MNPCVVVANSCCKIRPENVIQGILEADLPEPLLVLPEVRGYSWHVDNKYYDADIQVCSLDRKSIGTQEFADAVNAFILPFDSTVSDGLSVAEQWLTFIEELDPEIKILLCYNCTDEVNPTAITKIQAQNWCVINGFELVELNPVTNDEDSDVEDDFPESTGIKRVIQALHAHVWHNLVMKDDGHQPHLLAGLQHTLNGLSKSSTNPHFTEGKTNSNYSQSNCANSHPTKLIAEVKPIPKYPSSTSKNPSSNVAVVNPTPMITTNFALPDNNGLGIAAAASSEDNTLTPSTETDSTRSPVRDERLDAMFQAMGAMPESTFEELFNNLNEMKTKAESLSPSQRKAYAEKVAISFWKSVSGGNDSEVEGISSEED